jgi:DNA-binding FadR family transcriptional regulator
LRACPVESSIAPLSKRLKNGTDDFALLLETRCRVEAPAFADAIRHAGTECQERLGLLHDWLAALEQGERSPAREVAHRGFHVALLAACPSPCLPSFCAA